MCALLANKRYELLYNCGIQLLHLGRPLAAFECLMEAVQVYHSNPRLWLRLAECCIAANKGVRQTNLQTNTLMTVSIFSIHRLTNYFSDIPPPPLPPRVQSRRPRVFPVKREQFSPLQDRDIIARLSWHHSPLRTQLTGVLSYCIILCRFLE